MSKYIPALKFDFLTKFYDPLIKNSLREGEFKSALIDNAEVKPNAQLLDLGCGTGTLTLMLKSRHTSSKVIGLDGDVKILDIAKKKSSSAHLDIEWVYGHSTELPFEDSSVDHIFSSLMFHHLTADDKRRTLKECYRVLKPGAFLHIADWGIPSNLLMRAAFYLVQFLDGFSTTEDNVKGLLVKYCQGSGLLKQSGSKAFDTVFGTVRIDRFMKEPETRKSPDISS